MMKKWYLVVILLPLALAVIFLGFDIRAVASQSASEHRLATYRLSEELPEPLPAAGHFILVVDGQDNITGELCQALGEALAASPAFAGAAPLIEATPSDDLHLLVNLEQESLFWTPLYARSQLVATVTYASDGDVSWREMSPVIMESGDGAVVWAEGQLQLNNTTRGLISWPAYRRLLAQEIAARITQLLESIYAS